MKLEDALKTSRFVNETHKATLNLMYSSYWLKNHISAVMKDNGLTAEQFNVLRILKGMHPTDMCVKDIGNRMIEKSSNVPRIIDKLLAKKLVQRNSSEEDKRETLISLTESGIALVRESSGKLNQITQDIIGLSEAEAQQLNELLEKMRKVD